jgi:hypothetical protein
VTYIIEGFMTKLNTLQFINETRFFSDCFSISVLLDLFHIL